MNNYHILITVKEPDRRGACLQSFISVSISRLRKKAPLGLEGEKHGRRAVGSVDYVSSLFVLVCIANKKEKNPHQDRA